MLVSNLSRVTHLATKVHCETCETWDNVMSTAVAVLKQSGVIAVPTDTIYGVASLCSFIDKLYLVKERDLNKPVALCLSDVADLYRYAKVTVPNGLLNKLLPGPVTVVFERSELVPATVNPGINLIGLRVPNSKFIRELVAACGQPLALTSANKSGSQSCLSVDEFEYLWPKLDLVIDGGNLPDNSSLRSGSTVVDLSVPGKYRVIRPGCACEATLNALRESTFNLQELS